MTDMGQAPAHARPEQRDHLWVLLVIAACCLLEVWASWVLIGGMSGFPKLGGKHGVPTDWTLAVTTEAYWGYALYAWLRAAPGPKSRRFAKWSAAAVFALSLTGQGASHLVRPGAAPPPVLVVFVTALPVIVLALIAILIDLRQRDREDAAEAGRAAAEAGRKAAEEAAAADERTALRADLKALREAYETAERDRADAESRAARQADLEASLEAGQAALETLRGELEAAQAGRDAAQQQAQDAAAKSEILARKLDAIQERNRRRNKPAKRGETAQRNGRAISRATQVPNDVDARAEALAILDTEPGISGAELGPRVGKSKRWGQLLKNELSTAPAGIDAAPEGEES